ncbi:MAG TPA: hypothetical protein VNZ53_54955 [Steroidobacteraceae bacterium]|nr:hypothetical protein [Steroidobacteraceae bacterium]
MDKIVPVVLVELVTRPLTKERRQRLQLSDVRVAERTTLAAALRVIECRRAKSGGCRLGRRLWRRPVEEFVFYFGNATTEPGFGFGFVRLLKARSPSNTLAVLSDPDRDVVGVPDIAAEDELRFLPFLPAG